MILECKYYFLFRLNFKFIVFNFFNILIFFFENTNTMISTNQMIIQLKILKLDI